MTEFRGSMRASVVDDKQDAAASMAPSADEHMAVTIKKSGISSMVSLPARDAAEELRRWLKEHRCRLGPVFEVPGEPGQYGFFVYTRRQAIAELAERNVRFRYRLMGDQCIRMNLTSVRHQRGAEFVG